MRIIKFRGKVKYFDPMICPEDGWVEGYYLQDLAHGEICDYIFNCPCWHGVIPESIGQFTGLYDKNENEIYEGDIVKAPSLDPIFGDILKNAFTEAVIKYNNGAFVVSYYNEFHNIYIQDLYEKIEVIGNIYDNPELLKGGVE